MSKYTRADEIFDIPSRERNIIEWRAKRRLELRNEYLREKLNPNCRHEGHIFDPQIQRHYSTNFAVEKLFKPNVRNFIWFVSLTFGSISLIAWRIKVFRDAKEEKYRTGLVSYRDRDWKFC